MLSSTPDMGVSGRARVMTGRTNLSGQSARSMSFSTPRSDMAKLFSPIASSRAQSPDRGGRKSISARSSRSVKNMRPIDRSVMNKISSRQMDIRPETLSPELLTTTSKDYQLGFQEGLRQSIRPQSSSNLEESRSARARLKKQRAREAQAQKIQQRNEHQLNQFIKRNAEQMWEFVPSLYHTQRDEHHHLTADQWLVDKVKGYCTTTYGGDLSAMLHTFENKEVVERLSGSHSMRRILLPTVRMDIPESHKKKNPHVYGCGYSTNRLNHEMTMTKAFGQSTPPHLAPFSSSLKAKSEAETPFVPSFKVGGPFAAGPKPFLG